jgi:hypothetical protein
MCLFFTIRTIHQFPNGLANTALQSGEHGGLEPSLPLFFSFTGHPYGTDFTACLRAHK